MSHPMIIQGGMGIGVSSWPLANAVSRLGQLGVVSGTVLGVLFTRRLQDGDVGGHLRRAMEHFPAPEIAQEISERYFIPGGKKPEQSYASVPMFTAQPSKRLQELHVLANFVEIWLAKDGHDGVVGINFLEKIQLPNLSSIYGAMLAGVDYVCMGAGIPREIPGVLDKLAAHEEVSLRLDVDGAAQGDNYRVHFRPADILSKRLPQLKRPKFLAIISSAILAASLVKKSTGHVDGFIIEAPTAGGHNAPPRGGLRLNERGEPLYGPKDDVDYDKIKSLGRPFWLAGSCADPGKLKAALALGASGIQVGTAFALCEESSLDGKIKQEIIERAVAGTAVVFTDPTASPTGFPFKVVGLAGSISEQDVYLARPRLCDLGYLRSIYKKDDASLGYRCPAEPVDDYLRKGGLVEEASGRKCLCNGLMANIGYPQHQKTGYVEKPIVTMGDDLQSVGRFLSAGKSSYRAADVVRGLT